MQMTPEPARERISQAAFRLFGKKGYTCTSVQDIADAAGVKKSIVYYYFSSKEGLYQALLSESSTHLETFLAEAVAAVGLPIPPACVARRSPPAKSRPRDCEAQLSAIAEMLIGLARDNREPVRFFLTHIFAPDADRPACNIEQLEQLPRHLINQIAVAAVHSGELVGDPSELERLVLGAVQYSIIRHLRNPDQEPLAAGLGQRIVSAAVRGFLAPRATSSRRSAVTPSHADVDPA
jgi:AcrR family transcriptional regulator